jgi:endonuclease/exonuclease/phosphatase family metal-dependent hydrolase
VFFVAINFFLSGSAILTSALTIATYNVENYLVADRMVEGVYRPAYPKPEKEKAALRQVVGSIVPDILAVQEMGPPPFLEEFQRELRQAGQDYPYTALLEGADPDRHVAVLARVPFKEVRRHARVPINYLGEKDVVKRGVLEVVFATNEGDFSLFVVHLKSRHTERKDDPESALQRLREAEAVRDLILSRYPDPAKGRYILCGDWNDTRNSKPVRALLKRGERELGEVLAASDARGETWTHFYRREDSYSRIDYFLVSAALRAAVTDGRATICEGQGGSDHRPVFVQLKLTVTGPTAGRDR